MSDEDDAKTKFSAGVIARTIEARDAARLNQPQMATALGIPRDKYKQYEIRTPLPLYLMEQFCAITRTDPCWLAFGRPQRRTMPLLKMDQLK